MLAAKDRVTVRDGAVIETSLASDGTRTDLATSGDGALLRVSSGAQLTLSRSSTLSAAGVVDVQSGAVLSGKSILLDATKTTYFAGSLQGQAGGAFSVSAGAVALGETANVSASGLVLDNAQLAGLGNLGSLAIRSYSSIDLYGQANLGSAALGSLTLDARELAGFRARAADGSAKSEVNQASILARSVTLQNSGTGASTATPDGTGEFSVTADRIVFGGGVKSVRGFDAVNFQANR
jgi:hypothetical protein